MEEIDVCRSKAAVGNGGFTRVIPRPMDGMAFDAHAYALIEKNLVTTGLLTWEKSLYGSNGEVNGQQWKATNKKATMNLYTAKGTIYVSEKLGSGMKDKLWTHIEPWTRPK